MPPQNVHQLRPQQHQQQGLSTFVPPGQPFDTPSQPGFFNLDPAQAAKQMAALNAAGQARIAANNRVPATPLTSSGSGTSSGSYLGGINSVPYSATSHDLMNNSVNPHANFQIPNNHPMAPTSNSVVNTSFLDPPMAHPNATRNPAQAAMQLRQKQQVFLNGLASVMAKRNTPLPAALTGVPTPDYDPTNSPWKLIEPSSEVGSFRLAGKDVNLFKLWGLVQHHGGGHAISSKNGWGTIAAQFDLPEEFPQPQANGSASVANMLSQYYLAILYPFEELYKRNMPDHQRRMQMAPRQSAPSFQGQITPQMQGRPLQGLPTGPQTGIATQLQRGANPTAPMGQSMSGAHPLSSGSSAQLTQASHTPQTPSQRPPSVALATHNTTSISGNTTEVPATDTVQVLQHSDTAHELGDNVLDQDLQGIKRKIEFDEGGNKRARQKTEPLESSALPGVMPAESPSAGSLGASEPMQKPSQASNGPRTLPLRRKIEYVPLAREINTYGGRDLKYFETELANISQRRPLRDINDWGVIDIEALTMSLRSRLSTELSYALTTITLLSTMRGPQPGTGFPVAQCADLFDEILDLLEEISFGEYNESPNYTMENGISLPTNREIVNSIIDSETQPFAALKDRQGIQDLDIGPCQRPANIVLVISNIIRNFSLIFENAKYISQHNRALPLLFRLCSTLATGDDSIRPTSSILSLGDLVTLRKDVLYTLVNCASFIEFRQGGHPSAHALTIAKSVIHLLVSYLIDSVEALSPYGLVQLTGSLRPPSLVDVALEVFTRISQLDSNRQVISQAVPQDLVRRLFESLVHRLPVVDADFQLITRELWMGYVEKIIMAVYSLAFLAPPDLKRALKKDRKLGFKTVMLRMIRKFLAFPDQKMFMVGARRAVEAMKMLDEEEDLFDTSKSIAPVLCFGMGYGEVGETGFERGTGLLGGHRELTWEMLMHREVLIDEVMFKELESLSRVECV
ncbi:hypothetical protein AMATHDRAFT_166 [Amanita thiersii Skay4041]|uniref:ARID domain-containing protein n=1 Tax=Amanita thiersii Skay4041 TaxID=703135 RepID=A0A2A9P1L5_9AGAR|nr:hypothetical protein AMATHDRAFT_166 [Amanita thiersii Skay4041]